MFLLYLNFNLKQLTLHAKKAAGEASKQAIEVSKQAAGVSRNTLDDLTYVGKSTLGDLTKTAKEAATKKGLMKNNEQDNMMDLQGPGNQIATQKQGGLMQNTGRDFFSSIGSDINGLTSSTSAMFSGMFGGKSKQAIKLRWNFVFILIYISRATTTTTATVTATKTTS